MSNKSLSRVATDVINAYGITATNVINTYRFGGARLVEYVDARFESAVNRGAASLSKNLRANLIGQQQRFSGFYVKGLDFGSTRAQSAVGGVVDIATKGVSLVASNAARLDRATNLNALDTLNRVVMPAATVVSKVAERIEEGSSELVRRVAGKTVPARALAKRKLTTATRKAAATRKRVTKATTKRVNKAVAETATGTSKVVRRVARQAKTATQQVNTAVAKTANKTSNAARRVARKAEAAATAA